MRVFLLLLASTCLSLASFAQNSSDSNTDVAGINWHLKDPSADALQGVSSNRAMAELLAGKQPKEVVVAVIDSGVDTEHEDLQGQVWENPNEIPDNGIDDDNNGYIDDIHGWNFLGSSDGSILRYENLEVTRMYRDLKAKFGDKTKNDIAPEDAEAFKRFEEVKMAYAREVIDTRQEKEQMDQVIASFMLGDKLVKAQLGTDSYTLEDVRNMEAGNPMMQSIKELMVFLLENDFNEEEYREIAKHYETTFNYHLNVDYNGREMLGDNPNDINDRGYGNNNVRGESADHGTHVAGIIAAKRNNSLGMDGIAPNVKVMCLRAVPDGDEYDKDIALAILYAVENGAQIINMSFGKTWSPNTPMLHQAIKAAEDKGVLLVHAAGNDASNNDKTIHFPSRYYTDGTQANNYLVVGASSSTNNEELVADFSNYGRKNVDVFAPGVDIYSLEPDNEYKENSGTSMAAPVTSGVAAMLLSYFPSLTATELKSILMESTVKHAKLKVLLPNQGLEKPKKTKLKKLCVTGGVINGYEAVKLAQSRANATSAK